MTISRILKLKHAVTAVLLGIGAISAAIAADPRSQAEVDRMFPLPAHFSPEDMRQARLLARNAAPVMDEVLLDKPSARFKNVRAVAQADWRSWDRNYYICGQINSRNRFGAYSGWQYFAISRDSKDETPSIFYQHEPAAMIFISTVCGRGRDDRYFSDISPDYEAILRGAK